jgi:DnaJ family protein B protein 12
MEVNKDEALRCLDIAKRHLSSGDLASARKFGLKSASLYPTPEAEAFITTVSQEEAKSSSRGTKGSENRAETSTSSASQSAPDHKPAAREYTEEQASAVREIQSSRGDFYKVLGVEKDATDTEIKKAYRKVTTTTTVDQTNDAIFSM